MKHIREYYYGYEIYAVESDTITDEPSWTLQMYSVAWQYMSAKRFNTGEEALEYAEAVIRRWEGIKNEKGRDQTLSKLSN